MKKPWYKAEFYVGRAVKPEELMNFSRQTASFLRAGVPILDSLAVVGEENASKKMQEVIADMQRRLRAGSSFGDAIAQHPKVFPGYYVAVVRAAELTGRLDDALEQLSEYMEREVATQQGSQERSSRIRSSCSVLAIVAVIIMSVYVLPKFTDLYTSLNAHLPLPTRMLLGFTKFMSNWWWLILAISCSRLLVSRSRCSAAAHGKARRDRTAPEAASGGRAHAPDGGRAVLQRPRDARAHRRAVPDAVQVSADSTNNSVFQAKLATVREAMMRGEGLARPIQASGLFPPAARQMIRVGESTGSLDAQLENAAKFYERELKFKLKRATDMFEPAIILIVGGWWRSWRSRKSRRCTASTARSRSSNRSEQSEPRRGQQLTTTSPWGGGTFRRNTGVMNEYMEDRKEQGFTLIELLIAIVVVGILTAVAIVGIAGLTNKGAKTACAARRTRRRRRRPCTTRTCNWHVPRWLLDDLTSPQLRRSGNRRLAYPVSDATLSKITTNGWTLTMTGRRGQPPRRRCLYNA